ncbi:MAG: succinyl-diaminopimelate desuccinylase [Pseudomonadota bacterium]
MTFPTAFPTDPVELTKDLVRCASVTPAEGGAIALLEAILDAAGFECSRISRGGVENLFARWGKGANGRTFGYNGHIDVVPVGDEAAWTHPPFAAIEEDGFIYGRGSVDMKSSVAAFTAAAIRFVTETPPNGSVVVTITGDEEGPAMHGTAAILDWMHRNGERMDHCLVGEPTSPTEMGEAMKIGRRGSVTAYFIARGVQGHAAYPHLAVNPVPVLAALVADLSAHELDQGNDHFDPSNLEVVTFDTGNSADNVIPATCHASVNIRFNDNHDASALIEWMQTRADAFSGDVKIEFTSRITGESFITPPGELSDLVVGAVEAELARTPIASTAGGTSDARFIKDHCPVVEFGLVGQRMHAVDERVPIKDIQTLSRIYHRILENYFA